MFKFCYFIKIIYTVIKLDVITKDGCFVLHFISSCMTPPWRGKESIQHGQHFLFFEQLTFI